MKKILFVLFFMPMVCFAEIEFLDKLPETQNEEVKEFEAKLKAEQEAGNKHLNDALIADEQLKKFQKRFEAEQEAGFDPTKPYKVGEESGPWKEYATRNTVSNKITYRDVYKSIEEYVENISDEFKNKIGIIKKDELIALINELELKLELMKYSKETESFPSLKESFSLIKKYPYSSMCNQKLLIYGNSALMIALNSKSVHKNDLFYIVEKLTNHSLGLSEIYDCAIYNYVDSVNKEKLTKNN